MTQLLSWSKRIHVLKGMVGNFETIVAVFMIIGSTCVLRIFFDLGR